MAILYFPFSNRRLILHLAGGVGVGAQGEARVVMAQHIGDSLDVYTILRGRGGEGVALGHNKDKSENPCGARATPHKDNNIITVLSMAKRQQSL